MLPSGKLGEGFNDDQHKHVKKVVVACRVEVADLWAALRAKHHEIARLKREFGRVRGMLNDGQSADAILLGVFRVIAGQETHLS